MVTELVEGTDSLRLAVSETSGTIAVVMVMQSSEVAEWARRVFLVIFEAFAATQTFALFFLPTSDALPVKRYRLRVLGAVSLPGFAPGSLYCIVLSNTHPCASNQQFSHFRLRDGLRDRWHMNKDLACVRHLTQPGSTWHVN